MSHRSLITLIFLALLTGLVYWHTGSQSQIKSAPTLTFDHTVVRLELAQTAAEKEQGLSDRTSLGDDKGMLFVYDHDVQPNFWMKNMHFPLDIIWLDRDYRIVAISPHLAPETYPQTFAPPSPIRYVLEVNSGFVDKRALKIGDQAGWRAYN